MPGSPPRAWGQLFSKWILFANHRFTPTCVGTTKKGTLGIGYQTVHPHVRGDNLLRPGAYRVKDGSPPRAWGQRKLKNIVHPSCRFTPTCVGTTLHREKIKSAQAVHPHVRGDNVSFPEMRDAGWGSPPRAWGQRFGIGPFYQEARFTPTCVGTTKTSSLSALTTTVHPHVRGDNQQPGLWMFSKVGSPPRAWGQRHAHLAESEYVRFTPTCVGTT